MIFCENCKHLLYPNYLNYYPPANVKTVFVDPTYKEDPDRHLLQERREGYTISPICNHSQCFETSTKITPVTKLITKTRIKGQAQLNRHNNCRFFEAKETKPISYSEGGSAAIVEAPKQKPRYKFWL